MANDTQPNGTTPQTNGANSPRKPPPYDDEIVRIAKYVHSFEDYTEESRRRARVALIDSMGCAMESLALSSECRKLLGPIVPGTTVPNGFKLPGTSHVLDPVTGGFNLGTMIRFLDHSDALMGAEWGHPSDNIGGILSTMDHLSRQHPSGLPNAPPYNVQTLLSALIKAYEIQAIYQQLNSFNARGIDQVILVKLASAAVVSWLLGNTQAQTEATISHVWMDGQALRTYRHFPNAGARKGWAGGDASARGAQLAILIAHGQGGAPTAITDPKWGFAKRSFDGKEFKFEMPLGCRQMNFLMQKPMPVEAHALTPLESMVVAYEKMKATTVFTSVVDDIKAIKVRTVKAVLTIIDKTGPLHNFAARDHCLQYLMAVTLLKEGAALEAPDYEDDSPFATDPRVDAIRDKITLEEVPEYTKAYLYVEEPKAYSEVTLVLSDGTEITGPVIGDALGSPRRDDTPQHIENKSRRNLKRVFGEERVGKIFEAVGKTEMPVSAFVDLFEPEKGGVDYTSMV